jgi:signal transduction histidine kinase
MTTLALAGGVDFLWKTWQEQGFTAEASTGRMTRVWYGLPTLLMWRATAGRAVAIVASPAFVQQHVVAPLQTVLDSGGVRLRLMDNEGHAVLPGENPPLPSRETVRTIVAPWVVTVVDARPEPDGSQFQTRRQRVIAGCALLTLLVLAATYFGVRATVREFEAVRLKSDFVAAVSHEFRTPLTLLRQFSDLLADNRVSSEAERHLYYAALQRGTRRLTRLVEDLLDFGRMEAGSRAFKVEPIRAKAWIESLIGEFQEEIRSKGYVVELSWTAPIEALVRVDAEAMSRAVWNLLDNAVKYSPTEKTIWVTGAADESQLRISVRDRGVGIPPNEQRLIFRKFVRGSQPPGHTIKGTGLGLALVEQIVRAHGGGVHVESVGGEGSTFTISLPLDTALRAHVGLDAATPETIGQTPPMFAGASSDVRTSKPSA